MRGLTHVFIVRNYVIVGLQLTGVTKNGYFTILIELRDELYRSVFLATTILIGEKSPTSCMIARHLDKMSRDSKQRIANAETERGLKMS